MFLVKEIPAHIERFEFRKMIQDFAIYGPEFRARRGPCKNKMESCFWCGVQYRDGDSITFIWPMKEKAIVNPRSICQTCATTRVQGHAT